MTDAMLDLSINQDCEHDSMIMTLLDFNGNQTDENTQAEMILDGWVHMRNKLKTRLLDVADKLDAEVKKHSEEMALYRQQAEDKCEELNRKIFSIEHVISELMKGNNEKMEMNRQAKAFFQTIHDRKKTHTRTLDVIFCSN